MKKMIGLFLIGAGVILGGCKNDISVTEALQGSGPNAPASQGVISEGTVAKPAEILALSGTIKFVALEGGFFVIQGDDGHAYDPINLPDAFKTEGLKVEGTARQQKSAVSFHMYGTLIEIIHLVAVP
ncbi:hypothetical protein [Desulfoluna sp.]|uniref:hypothetical protein n=1 Tax=Desulfoluna sp. TaxID=2045199 RepID=UPI002639AC11|nr:hypothetical protein [Desulfoluna sp.]